jgi:chromosome partitioning protein
MKTLLIAAEKGGTGRSALLCQFAHYLRWVRGARVLVLDLAQPACSTASLTRTAQAVIPCGARVPVEPLTQTCRARAPRIEVLPAHAVHGLPSEAGESGARYYANMRHLLRVVAPFVDVCLIDCAPLPDPRAVCAEANADAESDRAVTGSI